MHRFTALPLLFALATLMVITPLILSGCSSLNSNTPTIDTLSNLTKGDWILSKVGDLDVASVVPEGVRKPSIQFQNDGSISGFSGVNRFMGSTDPAKLAAGELDLSKLASTRMAGNPIANQVEQVVLAELNRVKAFKFPAPDLLQLTDGSSDILTFARQATP